MNDDSPLQDAPSPGLGGYEALMNSFQGRTGGGVGGAKWAGHGLFWAFRVLFFLYLQIPFSNGGSVVLCMNVWFLCLFFMYDILNTSK